MIVEDPRALNPARDFCELDLYFFSRYMMLRTRGIKWHRAPHHPEICNALMRVFRGECKRLIINIPPRYSKTELVIMFMIWALGLVPDSEFIMTSYSGELAANNSWKARDIVRHEAYREIFPHVEIMGGSSARDHWKTTKGGVVYARGAGGTITGFGAGKKRPGFGGAIIVDDPHKADEAASDVIRKGTLEWFSNTLESRLNTRDTPIIVIMQRLHEEDLAGWLLAGGNGEEWEHLCLPAIQEDGSALWPEMHTIEDLRRLETASPYNFAGQYLQRPAPPGGGMFKPDALGVLDSRPACVEMVRAWDLAGTIADGDWTVGLLLGRTKENRYVILDVRRLQGSPDEVEQAIVAMARLDGHKVRVALPQDPGQAGKAQLLYLTKALAGFRVIASPESGDKETRAGPIAAQVNLGNVDIVRGEWNLSLLNEMRNFPFAKHDDQIDALSRAFMTMTERPRGVFVPDSLLLRGEQERVARDLQGFYR
jgi:predicted phage terminase large subunit-like protein